ncbi:hypothetical protein [Erythrobacter litoralis]|uniref:Uncharacterized protein n=1 Tax=Erythrobacter litoralis (strain HTCC2594) TaxID=314225 RepID=Q2N750_ERYLH|nr:hypothetical protein [Erythrobacter litoralis]ABC64491.1 hypothetical protein ELI_11995 [Erythrobacter litoralis HTCC2594]
MLHKFFEPGDWFAPKKIGYGAGLPIAWQGWVLLFGYLALVLAIAFGVDVADEVDLAINLGAILLITIPFIVIVKRGTKGGWKWRG